MGLIIKRLREKLQLSQTAFAKILGVSPKVVNNWEQGVATPPTVRLQAIAAALGCSIDDLFPKEDIRG